MGRSDAFFDDLRFATRLIVRKPAFASLVILLLALGSGATTAVLTLVESALLRPLPYRDPSRLALLKRSDDEQTGTGLSLNLLAAIQRGAPVLESLAAFQYEGFSAIFESEPERLSGMLVTANLFSTLGVQPAIGANFSDHPEHEVILSHALWKRRFASDATVLGRSLRLNGSSYTLIGVMPPWFHFDRGEGLPAGFDFSPNADLWTRLPASAAERGNFLLAVARIQPHLSLSEAQAALTVTARNMPAPRGLNLTLSSLTDEATRPLRMPLLLLLGGVVLLLLVACANVANLLLSRTASRSSEFAIRASLGAGVWRLTRQLMTEYLVYAIAAAALGLLLAEAILRGFRNIYPEALQRVGDAHVNGLLALFALLFATGLAILFGLLSPGRPRVETRKWLVGAELALACILLTGAGLLTRSLLNLLTLDPGFQPGRVLTTQIDLAPSRYPTGREMIAFFQQLLQELKTHREVVAAGLVTILPLGGLDRDGPGFTIGGRSDTIPASVTMPLVSAGYFEALGIPLQRGRYFNDADTATSAGVAIVSEACARRWFPYDDAVGWQLLALGGRLQFTIVGVVRDVRHWGLDVQPEPMIYVPYLQVPPRVQAVLIRPMTLVVRSFGSASDTASLIRGAVRSGDSEQPLSHFRTMSEVLNRSLAQRRLLVSLIGSFAVFTVVLSITGIYAVVSFWVQQRKREAGIRSALGASPQQLRSLIIWEGMRPALAGLSVGMLGSLAITRLLSSVLYGVAPDDPLTFGMSALLLAGAAAMACLIPARQAIASTRWTYYGTREIR